MHAAKSNTRFMLVWTLLVFATPTAPPRRLLLRASFSKASISLVSFKMKQQKNNSPKSADLLSFCIIIRFISFLLLEHNIEAMCQQVKRFRISWTCVSPASLSRGIIFSGLAVSCFRYGRWLNRFLPNTARMKDYRGERPLTRNAADEPRPPW